MERLKLSTEQRAARVQWCKRRAAEQTRNSKGKFGKMKAKDAKAATDKTRREAKETRAPANEQRPRKQRSRTQGSEPSRTHGSDTPVVASVTPFGRSPAPKRHPAVEFGVNRVNPVTLSLEQVEVVELESASLAERQTQRRTHK